MDATPPTMKDMEAENGFSTSMLTFAAVMTIMIMIVGILGNFLTVAALIKCPKVRNVAAAFIMSLCIADLLFCALVLPFSAYRFIQGTWTPREFLCKMIPFIQYGNIGVSLLCIAMITINRYVMIAHHSSYGRIYKRHWIAAMIIFCWVFSYGMQLPTLVGAWGTFDYDPKLGTCSIMSDDYGRSSKTTLFITAFVIPCLIIIACYTKIFWVVHKSEQRLKRHANKQNSIPNNLRVIVPPTASSNADMINGQSRVSSADSSSFSTDVKQESVQKQTSRIKDQREVRAKRNEWRITKMVLAIFLSFVICYLPITIAKVADQDVEHPSLHIMSYIMLYLSACLNPIIYVIMNKQYRKAYKTVIMCQPGRLLNFGKGTGLGGNGADAVGSSVAEKWKDTGLSHNHSRTLVSQMSATDQQNTSFSSSVQMSVPSAIALELQTNNNIPTNVTINGVTIETTPISTETNLELKTNEQSLEQTILQTNSVKNNSNAAHLIAIPKNLITTNRNNKSKESNRITLVGGDIILEEEEEEEEEEELEEVEEVEEVEEEDEYEDERVNPKATLSCSPKQQEQRQLQTEIEQIEQPSIPVQTVGQPVRPTPVYVNASVLHQKKNLFYGQSINDTPDNINNNINTKLQTKSKLLKD